MCNLQPKMMDMKGQYVGQTIALRHEGGLDNRTTGVTFRSMRKPNLFSLPIANARRALLMAMQEVVNRILQDVMRVRPEYKIAIF